MNILFYNENGIILKLDIKDDDNLFSSISKNKEILLWNIFLIMKTILEK
jgi:hypothetical protein